MTDIPIRLHGIVFSNAVAIFLENNKSSEKVASSKSKILSISRFGIQRVCPFALGLTSKRLEIL